MDSGGDTIQPIANTFAHNKLARMSCSTTPPNHRELGSPPFLMESRNPEQKVLVTPTASFPAGVTRWLLLPFSKVTGPWSRRTTEGNIIIITFIEKLSQVRPMICSIYDLM